jgi:environmental stress-induced protein Ves
MTIVRLKDLEETPWKNGKGVTREIAHAQIDGQNVWRLSMADVVEDGAFSDFAGVTRILTVINGGGATLKSDQGDLRADLWIPVQFDGALKIFASLDDDPLTDLNLMFDPAVCDGKVDVLRGPCDLNMRPNSSRIAAIHILAGTANSKSGTQLDVGDTLFLDAEPEDIALALGAAAVLITIDVNDQIDPNKLAIAFL